MSVYIVAPGTGTVIDAHECVIVHHAETDDDSAIVAAVLESSAAYRFVPTGEWIDLSPEAVAGDAVRGLDDAQIARVAALAVQSADLNDALVAALESAAQQVRREG